MQTNVQTKKAYIEPKLAELGSVSQITLTGIVDGGSSGSCDFTEKRSD